MDPLDLQAYYRQLRETDRLSRTAAGRLEYDRTRELVTRFLPAGGPLTVLDVGGATGVHARWLAALGHRVHVVDPVPEQVAVAAALPGVTAAVGDARDLDHADASADVVLLLGPLYHLPERADRVRVLTEARRVTRPGGLVAAATIARHAQLLDFAVAGGLRGEVLTSVGKTLLDGRHDGRLGFSDDAWFAPVDDVAGEFADAGLPGARTLGLEGPGVLGLRALEVAGVPVPPEVYDGVLTAARAVEEEPTVRGAGSHLLTVVTR